MREWKLRLVGEHLISWGHAPVLGSSGAELRLCTISVIDLIVPFLVEHPSGQLAIHQC